MFREILGALLLVAIAEAQASDFECPRTHGEDSAYFDSWPESDTWHGSKDLAVRLPKHGTWPTTETGHGLAVKLFWYIDGFTAGEEDQFIGSIRRLDDGDNDAVLSEPTNAGGASLGDWTVLTGIHFPSAGCWEVSGEFNGYSLQFVVETEAQQSILELRSKTKNDVSDKNTCENFSVSAEANNYCADEPPEDWRPFDYGGQTYYFQPLAGG